MRAERPHLLAAPVPSPARYQGRPIYFTDLVVRADSDYRTLEDTFGGRIAYSIEHSHSGYNAARFHLLGYRRADRATFYSGVVGEVLPLSFTQYWKCGPRSRSASRPGPTAHSAS
jgi:hypothetical protein